MNPIRYAIAALWATILLLWSGAALAAAITMPSAKDLHALDLWLVIYSAVVSTLSGGTALAWRINKMLLEADSNGGKFTRPWLFAVAHMGGSWMAGAGMLFLGGASQWDIQYLLFAVLVASFSGAAFVEKLGEKMLADVTLVPGAAR